MVEAELYLIGYATTSKKGEQDKREENEVKRCKIRQKCTSGRVTAIQDQHQMFNLSIPVEANLKKSG